MKPIVLFFSLLLFTSGDAQVKIGRTAKRSAERTAENKVSQKSSEALDRGIDEGINQTIKGVKKVFRKKDKKADQTANSQESGGMSDMDETMQSGEFSADTAIAPGFGAYSNFTFIPGSETIFYDDFSTDMIGDFPVNWETGGSGEVVTTNVYTGQWLSMLRRSGYMPAMKESLPENYTIEFDLATNGFDKSKGTSRIFIRFLPKKAYSGGAAGSRAELGILLYDNFKVEQVSNFGGEATTKIENRIDRYFDHAFNGIVHVSIAVNKQRLRIWLDEEKVVDAPSLLQGKLGRWFLLEAFDVMPEKGKFAGITNFRIAKSERDLRSMFAQSGKYSTTGIYFNVDEAIILPQSYAVVKSVADVLKSTPNLKLKIVGHTDNSGSDARNMELSLQRANAVKDALVKEFAIDPARLDTDGRGPSEPVADNAQSQGRAKNRRVEFIRR